MKRLSRNASRAFIVAIVFISSMSGCTPVFQGDRRLSVPYFSQLDPDYCVPATILMWMDYASPLSYADGWEHNIWAYAEARGWAAHGTSNNVGGVWSNYIADLATYWVGFQIARNQYASFDKQRAVADQEKALDGNDPTLVEANYGVHAVLVVGASWRQISNARPSVDYMVIHDPAALHSPYEIATLDYWMNSKGTSCFGSCIVNYMRSSNYAHFASAEYADFEQQVGTYYDEPNPPALASGEILYANQFVDSRDGRFRLIYQGDGNLVLYGPSGAVWASDTWGTGPGWTAMQGDGNLVVYDSSGTPRWASNTAGYYGAFLGVHNNGNLVIYTEPYDWIWQTGTGWW